MEELLSRIFATLSNLENPNHGDDSARVSFLLEGNSMFRCALASEASPYRLQVVARHARCFTSSTMSVVCCHRTQVHTLHFALGIAGMSVPPVEELPGTF